MKFRASGCMGCMSIATCRKAQLAGPAEIAQGLVCDEWTQTDIPTLTARTETVRALGITGLRAIMDVSTLDIVNGEVEPMSDLNARKEELKGLPRPRLKTIIKEHLSDLDGKELKAALTTFDESVDWPADAAEAKRLANKKAIRKQPPEMVNIIVALEFPGGDDEEEAPVKKTGGRTKAAAETDEDEDEAPVKKTRTRRTRKTAAPKEEEKTETATENGGSTDFTAFAKTINGIAGALEELPEAIQVEFTKALTPIYEKLDTLETALVAIARLDGLDEVTDLDSLIELSGINEEG